MGFKDVHLANTSDLDSGEMKEVAAGETRILLARVGDQFECLGDELGGQ